MSVRSLKIKIVKLNDMKIDFQFLTIKVGLLTLWALTVLVKVTFNGFILTGLRTLKHTKVWSVWSVYGLLV